jgi:hypothetical protein
MQIYPASRYFLYLRTKYSLKYIVHCLIHMPPNLYEAQFHDSTKKSAHNTMDIALETFLC